MNVKKLFSHNETYLLLLVLAFATALTIINPAFLTLENMFDLLRSSSGTALLAIGVFVVLLSGGIDMSFATIAIIGQYISVNVIMKTGIDNIWFAFAISCSLGIALGAINALLISTFKLPTLITTLGTSSLYHGLMLEFVGTKAVNVGSLPECFKSFGKFDVLTIIKPDGTTYGLSIYFIILLVMIVITWYILRYTMIGRGVYAIGGNMEAARRAGYNTTKIQYFVYCYAGFLAGIMGVIHLSLIRYSNPNYIVGSEMTVIAAVVLGGARISGGSGTITGSMIGVALITILEKNLILMGLSSYWQEFFIGLIIVVGVSFTYAQNNFRSRKLAKA